MSRPESAEFHLPPNVEFAGALQAVLRSIPGRDFELDLQQEASLEGIGHAVATGNTTGYIEMATGTGKTTVEALLAEAAVNAGQRVLLLAPSVTAANQIIGTNSELPKGLAKFTDLHDRQVIRQHYGTRRATRTSPVVVSTYNGFLNDYQRNHDSLGHFDVVIADECHRSLGEKTAAAMTAAYPDAIKIGLSATPDYAVDRTSEEVYSKSLFEFSLADAIESGKTAPIRALVVESDTVLTLTDNRAEFTEQEQAPLMNDVGRNAIIAGLAADFVKQGRQGIVACVAGGGNFHARSVAQLLARPEFGEIRAADIGAHLDRDEVARRLKAFEKGDIDVLTSTRAILESWDSGRASFCINAAPTTSPVKLKQLLGRILRPKEDGTEATFIDLIDGQTGLRKQQYTALHALGLEDMDFKRVLGRQPHDQVRRYTPHIADLPEFSGDLLDRLSKVQGRTLSDIFKSKLPAVVDPLVGHWETVLSKEGLPAELPSHAVVPDRFTKLYDKEFAKLFADNGVEPDHEEVLAGLGTKITREARRALETYGIRQDIGRIALAELLVDENDYLTDSLATKLLAEQIHAVLDTLTEREAGIIAMRFGFEVELDGVSEAPHPMSEDGFNKWVDEQILSDRPWTHRQIGGVYGVTLERIRQIESKTMSKLRHPSRAEVLESYADVSEKLSPYAHAKADKRYANAEMFARLKEARETGLENLMEDDSLTFTDSATLMTLSHDELKAARAYNHKATRRMCQLFGLRRQPQGKGIDYEIKFRKDALNQQMIGRQLVSSNVELDPEVRSQYWQEMQFYNHALQVLKRFEIEIDRNSSVRSFITS